MKERGMGVILEEARRSGELDELGAAFQAWSEEHGLVWFDREWELAQAIADVLGVELKFGGTE
jgi:hypothetical protein